MDEGQPTKSLMILAIRASQSPDCLDELRDQAEIFDDWEALESQCLWHGVLPTVYGTLSKALGPTHQATQRFRELFARSSLTAFQTVPEFIRILDELRGAGIPALGLKGLAVAQQVYGNFTLRPTRDLDLLGDTSVKLHAHVFGYPKSGHLFPRLRRE